MNNEQRVKDIFTNPFNLETYQEFLSELLNKKIEVYNTSTKIDKGFTNFINKITEYTQFKDKRNKLKLYAVEVKNSASIERARTMQRNYIRKLLINEHIKHALVVFYGEDDSEWRFSYVNVKWKLDENGNTKSESSPAKRNSYLVGPNQSSHTCQKQFKDLLDQDEITITQIAEAFKVEKVTEEFFKKYEELFKKLKKSIYNIIKEDETVRNEFKLQDDEDQIKIFASDFAKKILGQIIFLYFIQKKGWLGVSEDKKWGEGSKNFFEELYNNQYKIYEDNFFNEILEPLFYRGFSTKDPNNHIDEFKFKVPFINGGIFENINNYDWEKIHIKIDNEIFKEILDTFNRYNFTVKEDEPLESEVAVDPEMLGKVFEKLLDKEEKGEKGAFYTPRHIVHQICQETLISYLHENTQDIPREDISKFIKEGHLATDTLIKQQEEGKIGTDESNKEIPIPNKIIKNKKIIDKLLSNVKVVDPAVGSGAFPVGMLNEIVQSKSIIKLLNNEEFNNYDLKKETIENSLYGVDKSYSATDITKLRFWLSLIVDEDEQESIEPLPNLDNKIMCGDSVIDIFKSKSDSQLIKLFDKDILESNYNPQQNLNSIFNLEDKSESIFKELNQKKREYFKENNKTKKEKLKKEIQDKKWEFIKETIKESNYKNEDKILKEIEEEYKNNESKEFFIWELEFSEVFKGKNPGFDIVIGNPPYVRHEKIKEFKPTLEKIYETYKSSADLYVYFFEKGIKLLKENGCISYITSNKYTKANYGDKLRAFVLENYIEYYIDYTVNPVFEEEAVDTSIIQLIKKNKSNKEISTKVFKKYKNNDEIFADDFKVDQKKLDKGSFIFIRPEEFKVKEKIEKEGKKIGNIKSIDVKRGITTGYNEVFIIDEETKNSLIQKDHKNKEIIKPLLMSDDIDYWSTSFKNHYLIFTRRGIPIYEYPSIGEYLHQYKIDLKPREKGEPKTNPGRKPGNYAWYEIQDETKYYKNFEKPKLVWIDRHKELFATYDDSNHYLVNSCYILNCDDENKLKIISALFNSKVLNFIFKIVSGNLGYDILRLTATNIKKLPIKFPEDEEISNKIISYVDDLRDESLNIDNSGNGANIQNLEKKLNIIIYDLYNLDDDDQKVIDNYLSFY